MSKIWFMNEIILRIIYLHKFNILMVNFGNFIFVLLLLYKVNNFLTQYYIIQYVNNSILVTILILLKISYYLLKEVKKLNLCLNIFNLL